MRNARFDDSELLRFSGLVGVARKRWIYFPLLFSLYIWTGKGSERSSSRCVWLENFDYLEVPQLFGTRQRASGAGKAKKSLGRQSSICLCARRLFQRPDKKSSQPPSQAICLFFIQDLKKPGDLISPAVAQSQCCS